MQPPPVRFSGFSEPMIGHIIPGVKIVYPVITRNYDDLEEQVKHKQAINPVVKFPGMHDEHAAGHPMIKRLKQLLTSRKETLRKGYARMTEDLSWRSQSQLATTHTQTSQGTQT